MPPIIAATQPNELDADLYGSEQATLEQDNLTATGNINMGLVIDYDAHSQSRAGGVAQDSSEVQAENAAAPGLPMEASPGESQAHFFDSPAVTEQSFATAWPSGSGGFTPAQIQDISAAPITVAGGGAAAGFGPVALDNALKNTGGTTNNTTTNNTENITNSTSTTTNTTTNNTTNNSIESTLIDTTYLTEIINNPGDTINNIVNSVLGGDLIDIDITNLINGVSNVINDNQLIDLDITDLGNSITNAVLDNDLLDLDLGVIANTITNAIEDNDVLDIDLGALVDTATNAIADNDFLDLDLGALSNSVTRAIADNDTIDTDIGILTQSITSAIADNDLLDGDLGLLNNTLSRTLNDNDIVDLDVLALSQGRMQAQSDTDLLDLDLNLLADSQQIAGQDNDLADIDLGILGQGTSSAAQDDNALGIDLNLLTPSNDGSTLGTMDLALEVNPSELPAPLAGLLGGMDPIDTGFALPPLATQDTPLADVVAQLADAPQQVADIREEVHATLEPLTDTMTEMLPPIGFTTLDEVIEGDDGSSGSTFDALPPELGDMLPSLEPVTDILMPQAATAGDSPLSDLFSPLSDAMGDMPDTMGSTMLALDSLDNALAGGAPVDLGPLQTLLGSGDSDAAAAQPASDAGGSGGALADALPMPAIVIPPPVVNLFHGLGLNH